MQQKREPLVAVDLFAGCGGLTVGLKRAGFRVVTAVEIEKHAFATYKTNHPEVHGYKQDIRSVSGRALASHSLTKRVDVLAGCPPCQGFSSLTSKLHRSDPRDELVYEMGRLVFEIKPEIVMMENVPGLVQRGRKIFDDFQLGLERAGYVVNWDVLQVADYGVPQRRRRLVMLAGKGFPVPLPKPTHSRTGEGELPGWRTVRETIEKLQEPVVLEEALSHGGPQAFGWHVVRQLSVQNQRRLKYAKTGKAWTSIPKRLRPECHKDKEAGFSNVYGRMSWDEPSVTITGGSTTLSKGRFGHPSQNRTISVLEAALLQTFPGDYIFDTPYMEYACDMIGNALPCDFAAVLSKACAVALRKHRRRMRLSAD
jgi:DNA (cytosine-5)-methyltransferase 1